MRTNQITKLMMCLLLAGMAGLATSCGDDEPAPANPQLQFTNGGGNKTVDSETATFECDLSGNIPFSQVRTSTTADWCTARLENTSQSGSQGYYTYRLKVTVADNVSREQRQATVSVSDSEGIVKRSFVVTQLGNAPYAAFRQGGIDEHFNADARTLTSTVETNIPFSAFSASVSQSAWSSVQLNNVTATGEFPYVYEVAVTLAENISDQDRATLVTLNITEGNLQATFTYKQAAATLVLQKTALGFDKNAASRTVNVTASNSWVASSSASWCKVEQSGTSLTINVTAANTDREAVITFKDRADKITVRQTKYAVGETYNEGGTTGTVAYIGDDKRFIYRFVSGRYSWSSGHQIQTGASSETDGYSNTQKVKAINGWQTIFPAFAAVDALNTGGVSGWYLPAVDELSVMLSFVEKHFDEMGPYKRVNTSTEGDVTNGGMPTSSSYLYLEYVYGAWQRLGGLKMSSEGMSVFAIRQF
ncbi:MAG: BACON domain-containing protein [Muribaculaceae bacterium]|nr:BACON domain-containing protein [Muribaculaceae bacterium]